MKVHLTATFFSFKVVKSFFLQSYIAERCMLTMWAQKASNVLEELKSSKNFGPIKAKRNLAKNQSQKDGTNSSKLTSHIFN